MGIAWSGLADSKYYNQIAKYCLPSWQNLPGDKYIVHDSNDIQYSFITTIDWKYAYNKDANFIKECKRTKPVNFWRKMQSQIWALKNLKRYDWVVLLDTDVEVINFNKEEFDTILKNTLDSRVIWATGESQKKKLDAGHIVVNMRNKQLDQFIYDYENVWESGKIFELDRYYDGHAVESLFDQYPSYKIKNIDHGGGLHTYNLGTVHYGSKIPKLLRALYGDPTETMVNEIINEKNTVVDSKVSILELESRLNERS